MSRPPTFRLLLAAGVTIVPGVQAAFAVQYLTVDQVRHEAFPTATSFTPIAASRETLAKAIGPEMRAPESWSPLVTEARSAGRVLGWLIVDQVVGKTDLITFAVAIDHDGAVSSLEILEYREAHGSEVRLPAWRRQFKGRRVTDHVAVGSDIRNISGATLSCTHVTEGVRRTLLLYDRLLRKSP